MPKHYAPLLAKLEQVLESCGHQAELASSIIKELLASLYIELSGLAQSSEHTQSILSNLPQSAIMDARFLPRILSELETLIFSLDQPQTLWNPLQRINSQLEARGWTFYASKAASIIADIERALSSEIGFAQEQWQIERQLQELYSAIYNTEQAISTKIGDAADFTPASDVPASVDAQSDSSTDITSTSKDLRELRIAVEDLQQSLNAYFQRPDIALLPEAADITNIGHSFDELRLPTIRKAQML